MHTLRSTNLNKIVIKALLHFRFKANEYNLFKSYDLISSLKTKLFVMIFCKENKNNK